MNYDELENKLLDRRVQYCQFRIQQAISLIDDEIGRLSQRLKIYNYQIIECRDKSQELDIQIKSAEISQDGFYRMRTADLKTHLSRLKAYQCQQIQEVKQKHALEVESMQHDFENILRNFNHQSQNFNNNDFETYNQKYINQEKMIQKQIEIYRSKVQTYREAIQQQQLEYNSESNLNDDSSFYEETNSPVISELMKTIEERNRERYQGLIDSKKKLAECIEKIESMDRQHKLKINNLTEQINSIEDEYEKQLSQLSEKHEIKMISLKNHLSEAEKRERTLSRAVNKLEAENQKQLKISKIELQTMQNSQFKKRSSSLNEDLILDNNLQKSGNYYRQLKNLKSDIIQLAKKLRLREEELREKRGENQILKRVIGEVKHEIRFSRRMVGSVYPYFSKK